MKSARRRSSTCMPVRLRGLCLHVGIDGAGGRWAGGTRRVLRQQAGDGAVLLCAVVATGHSLVASVKAGSESLYLLVPSSSADSGADFGHRGREGLPQVSVELKVAGHVKSFAAMRCYRSAGMNPLCKLHDVVTFHHCSRLDPRLRFTTWTLRRKRKGQIKEDDVGLPARMRGAIRMSGKQSGKPRFGGVFFVRVFFRPADSSGDGPQQAGVRPPPAACAAVPQRPAGAVIAEHQADLQRHPRLAQRLPQQALIILGSLLAAARQNGGQPGVRQGCRESPPCCSSRPACGRRPWLASCACQIWRIWNSSPSISMGNSAAWRMDTFLNSFSGWVSGMTRCSSSSYSSRPCSPRLSRRQVADADIRGAVEQPPFDLQPRQFVDLHHQVRLCLAQPFEHLWHQAGLHGLQHADSQGAQRLALKLRMASWPRCRPSSNGKAWLYRVWAARVGSRRLLLRSNRLRSRSVPVGGSAGSAGWDRQALGGAAHVAFFVHRDEITQLAEIHK